MSAEDLNLIRAELLDAFCSRLSVDQLGEDEYAISTPFVYGDGDALPLILRREGTAWRLTDKGGAASHLFFDDLEMNPRRLDTLQRMAESDGFTLSDALELTTDHESLPNPFDLADLIQAVVRIDAAGDYYRRAPYQWYVTKVRDEVTEWVPEDAVERMWYASVDSLQAYPADLYLAAQEPVTLFIAGNEDKADRSALTLHMYREWGLDVRPLVAYRPKISDRAVVHLRDAIGADSVVEVPPDEFSDLRRRLLVLGVPA